MRTSVLTRLTHAQENLDCEQRANQFCQQNNYKIPAMIPFFDNRHRLLRILYRQTTVWLILMYEPKVNFTVIGCVQSGRNRSEDRHQIDASRSIPLLNIVFHRQRHVQQGNEDSRYRERVYPE